jgi:hypothetical protein
MTTKFIGVKEFRQNIAPLYKKAIKDNVRYIILSRNKPIFDIRPLSEEDSTLEKLAFDIGEARQDSKKKKVYTSDQVRKILGV